MAARGLSLVLVTIVVCISTLISDTQGEAEGRRTQIALDSVSVANEGDVLVLSVVYQADFQVSASWVAPTFGPDGMVNLDFEQTDTFSNGRGRSTMKIRHDVARTQNQKVFLRALFLTTADCQLEMYLPPFPDLFSSPPTTQHFHGMALSLMAQGRPLGPGEDLVWGRFENRMSVVATLSSPQLPKFKVSGPWVKLSRFVYGPWGLPGQDNDWGTKRDSVVHLDRDNWSGDNATKQLTITLQRRSYSSGILKVFLLSLTQRSGTHSLVTQVDFSQNLYVLREPGVEAVRENTVFIKAKHSHLLTEYDMPINTRVPEFSFFVVGNPMPRVSLYRGCREVNEAEAEVFETKLFSKYEITYFFRFKNATEALTGSYTLVARSGTMEAREVMSIGTV